MYNKKKKNLGLATCLCCESLPLCLPLCWFGVKVVVYKMYLILNSYNCTILINSSIMCHIPSGFGQNWC